MCPRGWTVLRWIWVCLSVWCNELLQMYVANIKENVRIRGKRVLNKIEMQTGSWIGLFFCSHCCCSLPPSGSAVKNLQLCSFSSSFPTLISTWVLGFTVSEVCLLSFGEGETRFFKSQQIWEASYEAPLKQLFNRSEILTDYSILLLYTILVKCLCILDNYLCCPHWWQKVRSIKMMPSQMASFLGREMLWTCSHFSHELD